MCKSADQRTGASPGGEFSQIVRMTEHTAFLVHVGLPFRIRDGSDGSLHRNGLLLMFQRLETEVQHSFSVQFVALPNFRHMPLQAVAGERRRVDDTGGHWIS